VRRKREGGREGGRAGRDDMRRTKEGLRKGEIMGTYTYPSLIRAGQEEPALSGAVVKLEELQLGHD